MHASLLPPDFAVIGIEKGDEATIRLTNREGEIASGALHSEQHLRLAVCNWKLRYLYDDRKEKELGK